MTLAAEDGLVAFDGHCNFCSAGVNLVLALDRSGAIRFTPLQSPYGRQIAAAHGLNTDDPSTFFFFDHGQALVRSTASLAVIARLPAPWRWARVLALLPLAWRDGLYDWIAANRYRLMGRRETCRIPTTEERARFVMAAPDGGSGV